MSRGWSEWNASRERLLHEQCSDISADVEKIASAVPPVNSSTPETFTLTKQLPSYSKKCHSVFERELWKRGISIRYYYSYYCDVDWGPNACKETEAIEAYHHRPSWNLYQTYKDHWAFTSPPKAGSK